MTDADEHSWRYLAANALEPTLNHPDLLMPAARHLGNYAEMTLFVIQQDDRWIAALPLLHLDGRQRRPHRVAATRTTPELVGGGPALLHRDCPERAAQALMKELRRAAKRDGWPGIVLFERLNGDGPTTNVLRATWAKLAMPILHIQSWERGVLRRDETPEFWSIDWSKERKRQIAKRRRRLGDALGGEPSLVDRADDPASIDDFLRLEASGWKGREGTALASRTDSTAFFREWAQRAAAAGTLRVFCFGLPNKPIAIQCAFILGESLCLYRIAFDDKYARYGPGVLLTAAVVEDFGQNMVLSILDALSDPGNEHFLDLLPGRRSYVSMAVGTGGPRDRLLVMLLRAAHHPWVRSLLERGPASHAALRRAARFALDWNSDRD